MTQNQTVLVVDDNAVTRLHLKKILTKSNIEVLEANDGEIALQLINEYLPDLVLLDLMMPVMDGEATLKEIRARFKSNELPVIIVTSNSNPVTLRSLVSLGCQDFIVKPFDSAILSTKVNAILDNQTQFKGEHVHEKSKKKIYKLLKGLEKTYDHRFLSLITAMLSVHHATNGLAPVFETPDKDKKIMDILKNVVNLDQSKKELTRRLNRALDPDIDDILDVLTNLAKTECARICKDSGIIERFSEKNIEYSI